MLKIRKPNPSSERPRLRLLKISANPIRWWADRKAKMPKLYKIAMRTLSAQASEVASERAFSSAGNIHTDLKKSMSPETLSQRLFVYANHPSLLETREPNAELGSDDESDD